MGLRLVLTKTEAITKFNQLGKEKQPFAFYCDFLGEKWCVETGSSDPTKGSFQLKIAKKPAVGSQEVAIGSRKTRSKGRNIAFRKNPIRYQDFRKAFDRVVSEINFGNSFLANLTFQTPIETDLTLNEIYTASRAKYRLLVPDEFVVFSPETFIKIKEDKIYSYPMKGTIDAGIANAKDIVLKDAKEIAEHVTIVDLIRNDLSQVATEVTVSKFRYIDELKTNQKHLLQVSSEVSGQLRSDWKQNIGSILSKLLPAGSISGAPKPETIQIIQEVENYKRGFYTGICGHFDGDSLDTGVMIRFIKKEENQFYFCSGGGITSFSEAEKEYQEMVDKIYLAF